MKLFYRVIRSELFGFMTVLISMFIAMGITWWIYNMILAPQFDLPFISYWQMWLIRLILPMLSQPIDIQKLVEQWKNSMDDIKELE